MSAVSHRHELELLRRGERETIGSLGLRVKDLVMKAYPKLDAYTRQELAIAPFIRALNDPQLEQAIWATTPATLRPQPLCSEPWRWLWPVRMAGEWQ
jgi:hypothetical protein